MLINMPVVKPLSVGENPTAKYVHKTQHRENCSKQFKSAYLYGYSNHEGRHEGNKVWHLLVHTQDTSTTKWCLFNLQLFLLLYHPSAKMCTEQFPMGYLIKKGKLKTCPSQTLNWEVITKISHLKTNSNFYQCTWHCDCMERSHRSQQAGDKLVMF